MNRDTSIALLVLAVAAIGIIVLVFILAPIPVAANSICLTKKEARHLWPRKHLYWYSRDHCWSNRRGPPRGLKFDPLFSSKAVAAARAEKLDEYNDIDAMADKPPLQDIIEDRPFGPWEERVAGAFTQ